ncbi:hypothetical protein CORC01_07332 [Colletotrichum orchidophilum]|uniref:NB-ARC domain-containing protein n=1 Tax=Colletotrichum orchidophilum TaxID=1209926 RepID=A0A1G4B787_9PEZI|nr:uncharacterized protein CORC01_07332 [Colletotrichum orchidophilum]OHE97277.1 hypothetical protein CORC01_07332 [Colletotrichum orchidophilum]
MDHGAYTIGWICALPKEMTAAIAMLDATHDSLPQPRSDSNNYFLGSIGDFHIVVASLPTGEIGGNPAAAVATRMLATFPNLKMGLMVGIGGGVPSKDHDIRLGDVVVSIPANGFGGVVQHDMGKNTKDGGWLRTGSLNGPPPVLRTTISKLISLHQLQGNKIGYYLSQMVERHPNLSPQFTRQDSFSDTLYEPEPEDPEAFESWKEVIKSGRLRDTISAHHGGVLCFEMEAAGLMNELPCVVIRGICDYADAHKNKLWQEYAAAVAAAYAKELVTALPRTIAEKQPQTLAVSPVVLDNVGNMPSQPRVTEPHWIVPFSRNKQFVGREQELSTLRQWSSSKDVCHNMAIFGLGGVGKTQIALEFAFRTKQEHPNSSIFWVPATDLLAFEQAYKRIGQALHVPGIDAKGADVKQLVCDALSDSERTDPWLLIIDNADDINVIFRQPTDSEPISPALIDYIPSSLYGSTILTTRNRRVAVKQAASNIISLEIMGQDDAYKLFEKSLLRRDILSKAESARHLLSLLGYLPLAIIQAVAYINENDTTIEEYTDLYNDSEIGVMEVLMEDFEVHGRYKTTKNSIATTWLVSFSQLTHANPVAIEYLSFMACICNDNIPQSLLLPASSKKKDLEAIGALKAYSFIRKREDGSSFDIHPLVHLAMRNWLRSEKTLQQWTSSVILRIVKLLPDGGHKDRSTWTQYLPHAKYLLNSAGVAVDGDIQVVVLAEKLGKCLYSNGEYSEAGEVFEQAVELRIKASGIENRDTLRNMFGMAEALNHQGKHRQAEIQHRKVLELRKTVLGPKDPEVGRSMNYLAQAMYGDGRYAQAEQVHRDAHALQNEVLHSEHPNILTTTGYLAQTLGKQGKYEEAETMHRSLLETKLRVMGERNPATLATMSCLGVAQSDLGRYADAEKTHRRVLSLRVEILGDRHPHTCLTKRWLADALRQQGKHAEAYSLNQETLKLQTRMLGAKHPNTILTLGTLGDILFSQGQTDRAEKVYRQALALQIQILGSEHPETLGGMERLANTMQKQGRAEEAKELFGKVFEARFRILGPQHPSTLATLCQVTLGQDL